MLNTYLKHVTYIFFLGCSCRLYVCCVLLQIGALFLFICSYVFDCGMHFAIYRGCLLRFSVFRLMCFVPTMCVMCFLSLLMLCVFWCPAFLFVFVSSVVYVLRCVLFDFWFSSLLVKLYVFICLVIVYMSFILSLRCCVCWSLQWSCAPLVDGKGNWATSTPSKERWRTIPNPDRGLWWQETAIQGIHVLWLEFEFKSMVGGRQQALTLPDPDMARNKHAWHPCLVICMDRI